MIEIKSLKSDPIFYTLKTQFGVFTEKFMIFKRMVSRIRWSWFGIYAKVCKIIIEKNSDLKILLYLVKRYDIYCKEMDKIINHGTDYNLTFRERWKQDISFRDCAPAFSDIIMRLHARIKTEIKFSKRSAKKWEIVNNTIQQKWIDIFQPGLLVHQTNPHRWTNKEIVRFVKVGLLCPIDANSIKEGSSLSFHVYNISFYLNMYESIHGFPNGIYFIPDPKWVKHNGNLFTALYV